MKIITVIGNRPQFVKAAAVSRLLREHHDELLVHTGQHHDDELSAIFFEELQVPRPEVQLHIAGGTNTEQTARMLAEIGPLLATEQPDVVLVYGDTNSTVAAALAAVKIHLPVAHLEAGLRSFNRRMPEEHNRVLTDHAADLLLAPTATAMAHLATEGLAERSVLVGDVMTDVLFSVRDRVVAEGLGAPAGLAPGSYYVATIHRPDNTDEPERLRAIVAALASLGAPVLLLAHPRLRSLAAAHGIPLDSGAVRAVEPLAYPALVAAVMHSRGVVTDSGGLQKEAFLLRVPATTIRPETEWVETVELGWNVLANDVGLLAASVQRSAPAPTDATPYGDGHAAARVVDALLGTGGGE